jgi:hypothetical protein
MNFLSLIIFISLFSYLNCTPDVDSKDINNNNNNNNIKEKKTKSLKIKKYSSKDLPFIGCSVCEKVSSELYSQVTKLTYFETQVERTIDNICREYNVDHYTWIHKYDIIERNVQRKGKDKRQLYLQETGYTFILIFILLINHIFKHSYN